MADIAANAGPAHPVRARPAPLPGRQVLREGARKGALAPVKAAGNMDNPRPETLMAGRRGDEEGGDVYGLTGPGYGHQLKDFANTKATVSETCKQTCKPNPPGELPTFSPVAVLLRRRRPLPGLRLQRRTPAGPGARRTAVAKTGPCKGKRGKRVTIVTEALAEPRSRRPRSSTPTTSPGRGT